MKNKLLLMTLLASASITAQAADTIYFQGEVSSQTCTVTVNGNSESPTVFLPTVSTAQLDTAGKTAGETPFTVQVSGCDAATSETNIGTIFMANNLTAENRIGNTGTAEFVSLELIDGLGSSTVLNIDGTEANPGLVLNQDETEASHDFAVRYYAEDAATAGSVKGSVQYAITYL